MGMKIGIIGGSGLENQEFLENYKEIDVDTPFGKPSSKLITGKIGSVEVAIIKRHGIKNEIPPTNINNKANIFALKYEGCKYILATTAVGSLREDMRRGDFVVLDDFIDFTRRRDVTFYDKFEFGSIHVPMVHPFSEVLRRKLIESCIEFEFPYHKEGTVVTIEGSRFSTRAESKMFRQWGADVINMTTGPEAILANEAEIPYGEVAMVTDYDCWKQDEESVTGDIVGQVMKANVERVKKVLLKVIDSFSKEQEILKLKNQIGVINNFPNPGMKFPDITPILKDKESLTRLTNVFYEKYKNIPIEIIVGIDSNGSAIAGMLAEKMKTGLVLINMLDNPTQLTRNISPGQSILIIKDLISEPEILLSKMRDIQEKGGEIEEIALIVELEDLEQKKILEDNGFKIFSVIKLKEKNNE